MKASPRQQHLLLDLQEIDNQVARLARKKTQIPARAELKAVQQEAATAREVYMSMQRELDTQNAEIERIESDIEVVRQRIRRDDELIAVSNSAKEAQALQNELETLHRRQNELEERELNLMEANEDTQSRFDASSEALAAVDDRRQAILNQILAAETEIDETVADQRKERAGLAAELQRDLLDHYESLRNRLGVGAAKLRGTVSEASNMELAPAELATIVSVPADELAYCPHSGAILVRVTQD